MAEDKHFVDEHRFELINRVSNPLIIFDDLLSKNVIDQQCYNEISALHPSHEMMTALFNGPLKSSGVQGKDIFYKILSIYEPLLLSDLKKMSLNVDEITAKEILFAMLNDLTLEELKEFKSLIELEKSFPQITWGKQRMENTQVIVKLMVETYGQECLEFTKKVLKDMNRTDLVQRLLDISSGTREKSPVKEKQLSLSQRVESMVSDVELLLATLAGFSDQDFKAFKEILIQIYIHDHDSSLELMKTTDMQDMVLFIVQLFGRQSVEKMKTILKNMNRTDLVQRLLTGKPESQKKHSVDEQPTVLIHKVATMAAVKDLLLEIFSDLSDEELKNFKWFLQFMSFQRNIPYMSWEDMLEANTAKELVDVLVKIYGQKSVDETVEVLVDMNRTDLVQRLSESSSGFRAGSSAGACGGSPTEGEKNSLYEHWPGLVMKEKTLASLIELLLDTMEDLNKRELRNYIDIIMFSPSNIPLMPPDKTNLQDIVFMVVQRFGKQALVKTKMYLLQIRRTLLAQRLSHSGSAHRKKLFADKHHSSLIEKVATVAAVKQQLLDTLDDLSSRELGKFKRLLRLIVYQKNLQDIFRMLNYTEDRAYIADKMVQAYGQQSVELTMDVLKKMDMTYLFQSLALSSTGLEVESSEDEQRHTLSERAAARRILLETLECLSPKELKKFWWFLEFTYFQRSLPLMPGSHRSWAGSPDALVDLMMESHGLESVEVTKDVFMDMKRTDLVQRLSETSSWLKVYGEGTSTSLHKKLYEKLETLDDEQLEEFKLHLQRIITKKGFKRIPHHRIWTAGTAEIVMLMIEMFGEQSLEVIKEALEDYVLEQQLSNISVGSKVEHVVYEDQPAQHKRERTMTSLHKTLLQMLEQLNKGDLEKFKHVLLYSKITEGLPGVPRQRMEVSDRSQIVEVMVEIYGQQSVEVTREVFMRINRSDLVQRLSDVISSKSEAWQRQRRMPKEEASNIGSLRCLKPEDCGSLEVSSGWTKLEPEVSYTDADEAQTYSLKSEAGHFECSVSGLRWFCKAKVSFKYQFCSRDEPMERMERMQYMFAGPLIDITVITGKLDEVHLPHWICIDDSSGISDKFAVLHINDYGDDVEKVSEVTTSHVKLTEPVFSAKAVLIKVGIPLKIKCNMLIYKTNQTFLTLHVYLIPRDPGKQQEIDKENLSYGYKIIRKPHPETSLKLRDRFILNSDFKDAKISPENLKLRYESGTPNFFEVYLENPDRNFKLDLIPNNETEAKPVWTSEIRRGDYPSTGPTQAAGSSAAASGATNMADDKHFVDKHQLQLKSRVNNIAPILDELLDKNVIDQENYDRIRKLPTSQDKMRELYSGCLRASSDCKDIFYEALKKNEPVLIEELEKYN